MKFLNILTLCLLTFNSVDKHLAEIAKTTEIVVCPEFCNCDLFNRLNRANCSSRHLSIDKVAEVPLEVEILDLSYNNIFRLDKDSFENFVFLKNLTISHNYIGTINHEAFHPLRSITTIDLSHNGLEYLDERIVKTNRRLQRLDLSNNKFRTLRNKPLLRSAWLRSLTIRNARISHLYPDFFLGLPNLRELDVSENRMTALNIAAFRGLRRLEHLNLNGNFMECNPNIMKVVKLLQKRDINIQIKVCDKAMHIGGAALDEVGNKSAIGGTNESAFGSTWHHLSTLDLDSIEEEPPDMEPNDLELVSNKIVCEFVETEHTADCNVSPQELCYKYRKCLKEKVTGKKIESGNDLYFIFLIGFAMGIISVVCFISCAMCLKRWFMSRRKSRDTTENQPPEPVVPHTAQPLIRHVTASAPALNRADNDALGIQVPRQRKPQTPTALINLFNNPLNQHLSGQGNEQQTSNRTPTRVPVTTASSSSNRAPATQKTTVHRAVNEGGNEESSARPVVAENIPDYPPPSYGELHSSDVKK